MKGWKFIGVSGVLVCLMRETAKQVVSVDRTEGMLVAVALLWAQLTEPELCARCLIERQCQAQSIFNSVWYFLVLLTFCKRNVLLQSVLLVPFH
jgi:hypothetical protein